MRKKRFHFVIMCFLFICFILSINNSLPAKDETQLEQDGEDVKLDELSLVELLNMEVTTAGRQREKISDIPASVVVVTREDIEIHGYQTLEEVLESIPGLYYTNDYTDENFGVRGFWTNDSLRNMIVLVNDIQQTEYLSSGNLLNQINVPVEAIDRIEVVRGPMSVMYGTGAFFGVINIKTNLPGTGFPLSMVSVSAGSEKTYKLFARASGDSKDFQYAFNASYYKTYGIDVPLSKIVSDPSALSDFGVPEDQTTGGRLENEAKYFNFSGRMNDFFFDTQYSESDKEAGVILPSIEDGTLIEYKALRLNFGFEKEFSEKLRSKVIFSYYSNRWQFNYDLIKPDVYALQTNGASGYKGEIITFFDPQPNLSITAGMSYNNVFDVVSEYTAPVFYLNLIHNTLAQGDSMETYAFYSQLNYTLSNHFKLVAGFRLEHTPKYTLERRIGNSDFYDDTNPDWGTYTSTLATYSHTKLEFIPRLALIWQINKNNFLKFLYGKAINRPSFFQNTQKYGIPPTVPELNPETIQTLEINYIGNLSSSFSISMSLFHNMLDKLIYRTFLEDMGVVTSYFANVGEMNTTGIEITAMYWPNKKMNFEISGTFQDTVDKRPGYTEDLEAGYSPKFLGYLKASYFFNRDISLAITGNYVDKMQPYYDHTLSIPGRIGDEVDGYFLFGANLRFSEIFESGLFANFKISNILNQEVRYPTTSNNSNYATKGTIGREFSFLVSLGLKF